MDLILERAARKAVDDLTYHGGGTYEAGTLIPFKPDHGFAVGIGGIHLPLSIVNDEAIAWALRAVTTEYATSFGGTWLDHGVVYFDAVTYYLNRDNAIEAGRAAGQKAIYDFGTKEAITL